MLSAKQLINHLRTPIWTNFQEVVQIFFNKIGNKRQEIVTEKQLSNVDPFVCVGGGMLFAV